jgi:uncharacterized protein (AIM24 family)
MADFARLPQPMPELDADAAFAGLAFRVEGGSTPYLAIDLEPGQAVLFEAASLLWKEPSVVLTRTATENAVSAAGPGRMGFACGLGGRIFPIPLAPGAAVQVRHGHALLCAGAALARERLQGLGDRLTGSAGFLVDRFTAGAEGGVVWVQARGEVFERGLMQGEMIDLHHGAFLCKDPEVALESLIQTNDPGARFELPCLRLTGAGRVAFDSIAGFAPMTPQPEAAPRPQGLRGVFTRMQG